MSLNMEKGSGLSFEKDSLGNNISVRLGWKENTSGGEDFDLDATCFVLQSDASGKNTLISDKYVVYYNQVLSGDRAVMHSGDDVDGSGTENSDGADNEIIYITRNKLNKAATELSFFITIHKAIERRQHFGLVSNAYVRIVDEDAGKELCRYNLGTEFNGCTAVQVGSLITDGTNWSFKALGFGLTPSKEHDADLMSVYQFYKNANRKVSI